MNRSLQRVLSLDREDMSDWEREVFLKDLSHVLDEYFESENTPSLEITRSDSGFIVCLIFSARRIKNVKRPL